VLSTEAEQLHYRSDDQKHAHEVIKKWAALAAGGHLERKETALDASFLHEVFGEALGYRTGTDSPDAYHLDRNFTVPGCGTADGALGEFATNRQPKVAAVIELKDAGTDLDYDRFNGRTAVEQLWDYLKFLPDTPWGIVSNYLTIRLYHRDKTPQRFEYFTLEELARSEERFRAFWCLLGRGGLLYGGGKLQQPPRAKTLLDRSETKQRQVGDDLYDTYSRNRWLLIQHLMEARGKSQDQAIHIAQALLDRIIFVAFCEDRGLLAPDTIEATYRRVPMFARVTNPRWQNFLGLFGAMDAGSPNPPIPKFNGGLFRRDSEVDDLQLDDEPWTDFFQTIGSYDYRYEVNVDVLGHIFEKSIAELERVRVTGLFTVANGNSHAQTHAANGKSIDKRNGSGAANGNSKQPAMTKSAERKRFGIYYTPPDFTAFLVDRAVNGVIDERFGEMAKRHGIKPEVVKSNAREPFTTEFWRDCLEALRSVYVCDPACGSGAFLIEAFDALEVRYQQVIDQLHILGEPDAAALAETIPDMILADNLYGVDLSPQAVEIAQLALWIRSARPAKTLADLSENIVCGNSLVDDPAVHPKAFKWSEMFPHVFNRDQAGFDCIVGNPPWERMKLQEREFFAYSNPQIAEAVNAADRRKLIAELEKQHPELHDRYEEAQAAADCTLAYVRNSGRYPLTGRGDVNTYMVFAELARTIVSPAGRVGILVPSGIATDHTTREFFQTLVDGKHLISLHDFENKSAVFADVHRSFKFCTLVYGGADVTSSTADFLFFAREMEDIEDRKKHISLSTADFALMNPNTRTCPIFRTRQDAEITRAVYKRVPILIDNNRDAGGNPWGVRFFTMFHQTNDAELFKDPMWLSKHDFKHRGNRWVKDKHAYLPLYEAKMVQIYDHRAASVVIDERNWVRQGQTADTTQVAHQNPEFVAQPRWWVDEAAVKKALGGESASAYLCYKDVTSPTNQRTMIAAFVPHVGVVNSAPLMLLDKGIDARRAACLLANMNSFAYDFIARQKVGGVHLNFFIVEQLPTFAPDTYSEKCPWAKSRTLERWISDRVLKLTCTANDMKPLAKVCDFDPPVHKWNSTERTQIMAELDAAFFILYGLERDEVEYILSTFKGIAVAEESMLTGQPPLVQLLSTYDALRAAMRNE
jgi:hypothetical protein